MLNFSKTVGVTSFRCDYLSSQEVRDTELFI